MSGSLALRTAVEQRDLVAAGEVSAVEVLDAALAQFEAHHERVNAVVVQRIDEARRRAGELDTGFASTGRPIGPLHGLPVTVKEALDWVGTPTTWGDPAASGNRPRRNAAIVQRLLDAGAVLWGKTNVPYRLHEWQAHNELHGLTRNPWDLDRSAGGSSGGSAAALVTGMTALEVGSDIGGSIRFPAHYCGVVGHKPSFGFFPADGHRYPGQDSLVDLNVVGPMARTVDDVALMFELADRRGRPVESGRRDWRVAVLTDHGGGPLDAEMLGLLGDAVGRLVEAGATVVDVPLPIDLDRAHLLYRVLDAAATCELDGPQVDDGEQDVRFRDGARDTEAIIGHARRLTHLEWLEYKHEQQRLRWAWDDVFADLGGVGVDAVLTPVSDSPAPPHDTVRAFDDQRIELSQGGEISILPQWFWAGLANGTYLPATSVPVGRTAAGLPVGLQVLGRFDADPTCLAVARTVEQTSGPVGWPSLVTG